MIFAAIFFFAFLSSFIFSGAYWKVSTGDYDMAMKLQKVNNPSPNISLPGFGELELTNPDWWRNILHSRDSRMVYYSRDDGSGDANDD
jgi:hypothetical protein